MKQQFAFDSDDLGMNRALVCAVGVLSTTLVYKLFRFENEYNIFLVHCCLLIMYYSPRILYIYNVWAWESFYDMALCFYACVHSLVPVCATEC